MGDRGGLRVIGGVMGDRGGLRVVKGGVMGGSMYVVL